MIKAPWNVENQQNLPLSLETFPEIFIDICGYIFELLW